MGGSDLLIGVISDTHGLMRPQALTALRGSDLIIHAGDVGRAEVLEALAGLAPTFPVRGNVDTAPWALALPLTRDIPAGAVRLHVLHKIADLAGDPAAAGHAAVIFGHSHKPVIERRAGVLYLNPGSAGPRRFTLPVTIARLRVTGTQLAAEIVPLLPDAV